MTMFAKQDDLVSETATQSRSLLLCANQMLFSFVMSFASLIASKITFDSRLQKTAVFISIIAFSVVTIGAIISGMIIDNSMLIGIIISIIIAKNKRISAA